MESKPGSPEAIKKGCACPTSNQGKLDDQGGREYYINPKCLQHEEFTI